VMICDSAIDSNSLSPNPLLVRETRPDPVSSSIGGQPPSPLARRRAHYGI
jgi:hypothetical protein